LHLGQLHTKQTPKLIFGVIDFAFFRRAIQSHTIRYRFQGISDRAEDVEQILPCRVLFIDAGHSIISVPSLRG